MDTEICHTICEESCCFEFHMNKETINVFAMWAGLFCYMTNVWKNMKKSIDDFNGTFNCLVDRIIEATNLLLLFVIAFPRYDGGFAFM